MLKKLLQCLAVVEGSSASPSSTYTSKKKHQNRTLKKNKRKTHAANTSKDFPLQQIASTGRPSGRYSYAIFLTSSLEHIIVRNLLSMHER